MPRKMNIGLSEEKQNIIERLIGMYDIKTAKDSQDARKDLPGGTIQIIPETELSTQHTRTESDRFGIRR